MIRTKTIWYSHQNPDRWVSAYPEYSIFAHLKRAADRYPNLPALYFEGRKYSYHQLLCSIERTARALSAIGVQKGSVVSIISPNTPQALIMVYAANRIGAVANMLHPLLSAAELQHFIESTNSSAVLILDMIYPKLKNANWKMEKNPTIILSRIVDALPWYAAPVYAAKNRRSLSFHPQHNIIYWNAFLQLAEEQLPLPTDTGRGDDTAVILYSGGTSGSPKGVMITNRNLNALAIQTYDIGGIEDVAGKRSLAVMPLFHGFGLVVCMHAMLCLGFQVFLIPKYDFKTCTELIFRKKINCIYGVPGLFEALVRSTKMDSYDLSFMELLVCGGDKLPEKLQNRMNAKLEKGGTSIKLREAYGQTECVAGCALNPKFDTRIGSVGIAYPDMLFKIVLPGTQEELPFGQPGELCVSGPTVMKGYYNNPEATQKALQIHADGKQWLHTGDIFSLDSDGYLYFHRRNSRLLVCSGYNVYATQVEDAVARCPAVAQCCVVGIQDRITGQRICACIVPNNPSIDPSELKRQVLEHCEKQLAAYAIPHEIRLCADLPMTNLGKVDYRLLEKQVNSKE